MKREMTTENFPERQAPSTLFDPQVDTRRPGYYYSYQPSRDAQPVLPINDERPFSEVLASFLERHRLTPYASDEVFLVTRATMRRWALTMLVAMISLACTWAMPQRPGSSLVVALPGLVFFGLHVAEIVLRWRMRRQLAALPPP